jgi:hypothetical protein
MTISTRTAIGTLGCLLARVEGRSPLEYLDDAARDRQRRATLALMWAPPATMPALADAWLERLRELDVAD